MRSADLARPHMEALADELQVECVASAVVGDEMVLVARAGALRAPTLPTAVGTRIPFEPPMGTAFVAWAPEAAQRAWFDALGPAKTPEIVAALERTLAEVREAGYSVGARAPLAPAGRAGARARTSRAAATRRAQQMHKLIAALPPDYESPRVDSDDVRTVSTPVLGPHGSTVLVLSVTVAGRRALTDDLPWTVERLRSAAAAVSKALEEHA